VNQPKTRTRIILPSEKEHSTEEGEKETTTSSNPIKT